MADAEPSYLETPQGARLAYHHTAGRDPTVVFLSGFASHMGGTKAQRLEAWCEEQGRAYLRLDYQGHGKSSGEFEDGTVRTWADDALAVIEAVAPGSVVLVGSSMGAWIMLLAALRLGDKVRAMMGLASAPDFTEELIHAHLDAHQRATLNKDGRLERQSGYDQGPNVITLRMLEEGREHLLLGEVIPLDCPVRLVHGLEDTDVPWEISLRLCERLESEDVRLILVKNGAHRLSEPPQLDLLVATLGDLLASIETHD